MTAYYVKSNETNLALLREMGMSVKTPYTPYQQLSFKHMISQPSVGMQGFLLYPEELRIIALLPTFEAINEYLLEVGGGYSERTNAGRSTK